jgi:hypothetical protein
LRSAPRGSTVHRERGKHGEVVIRTVGPDGRAISTKGGAERRTAPATDWPGRERAHFQDFKAYARRSTELARTKFNTRRALDDARAGESGEQRALRRAAIAAAKLDARASRVIARHTAREAGR